MIISIQREKVGETDQETMILHANAHVEVSREGILRIHPGEDVARNKERIIPMAPAI